MKTDYYELLGVSVEASDLEIKKAYRKCALRLHPDKNPDDIEGASRKFNEVKVAYDTLSDPQERAWYDSHKFQVLMEDGDYEAEDDKSGDVYYAGLSVEDILAYLNSDLYSQMDDSINGFYAVAGVVLDRIASEEVSSGKKQKLPGFEKYMDDTASANACDTNDLLFPRFGKSRSDYGDVVRIFYKVWSNFASVKSFNWVDEYRYSSAPDRRTRRLMEKENKKLRDQARRDYNEAVRRLISFLKKRDPRVNPAAQKKYEQDRVRKQQDEVKQQVQRDKEQRKKDKEEFSEQHWQMLDPEDLAEIEQQLDKLYMEEQLDESDEGDDDFYECIICNKNFKHEKQFLEHEKSRKHLKLLKKLQWEMRKEGIELGLDEGYVRSEDEYESAVEDLDGEEEEEVAEEMEKEPVQPDEEAEVVESPSPSEDEVDARAFLDSDSDDDWGTTKSKKKKKGRAARVSPVPAAPSATEKCTVCNETFSSRNKLFQHINNTGHALAPKKKKKGKRR
ncbi:hypothetical protein OGAPHI_001264 [Ogataea philodendri]|uniref:J protein JJJ1 n=1 Tax=Ogataea philodendri TaxID=1378263 RepID=A0A9P8PEE8_9ASCO|nr:uncharacterized protein OGAPHI_001264 [Ogataea philodendri]KAH3670748.1 hypothetical protein OGAPHI_001264 [Ogataea philodendri]